jgi:general stress protein 26
MNESDKINFATLYTKHQINLILKNVSNGAEKCNSDLSFMMKKAVDNSNSCKFAVLSTTDVFSNPNTQRISSRAIQPFPIEFDQDGNPIIFFNTNKLSRKVVDMNGSPFVSISYLNEKNMSCITYMGIVERIPYPESTMHWKDWLYLFYPEGNDEENGSRFTTWKIKPDKLTIVAYNESLGSTRNDARPPELRKIQGKWQVYCSGREENEE